MASSNAPGDARTRPAAGRDIGPVYSLAFILLTLVLLVSFLTLPATSLANLNTDFRWRAQLIRAFNTARYRAGDRLFNGSIIGAHGWMFYIGEATMPDYQHNNRLTEPQLAALGGALQALDAQLKQQGRTLLVMIPPNKSTVYPQYMPREIPIFPGASRLEQVTAYLQGNTSLHVIDLVPPLVKSSRSEQVYYKTDTHWTSAGAYVAYVQVMHALAPAYPALRPHPRKDFAHREVVVTRDLPIMMGIPQVRETNTQLFPRFDAQVKLQTVPLVDTSPLVLTINPAPGLPSLLIFHDSFYEAGLNMFLWPHFSRIVAVPFNLNPSIWNTQWVRTQPSDIVIIELTERYLDYMYPLLGVPQP